MYFDTLGEAVRFAEQLPSTAWRVLSLGGIALPREHTSVRKRSHLIATTMALTNISEQFKPIPVRNCDYQYLSRGL